MLNFVADLGVIFSTQSQTTWINPVNYFNQVAFEGEVNSDAETTASG